MKLFNFSRKILDRPESATMTEWDAWEAKNKKEKPILYFLLETAPAWIRCRYKWWITDPIYHLKCKYFRKYHYIKIDVDRFFNHNQHIFPYKLRNYHWYDTDTKMLYGLFQLVVDYIEGENPERFDWQVTPEQQKIWKEINELYDWWTKERPERKVEYPSIEDFGGKSEDILADKDSPARKAWGEAVLEHEQLERAFDVEDTEMMIRLITIRQHLWS